MSEADLVWGGLVLAGAIFEAYTLANRRPGDTLSETTRRTFRVHTRPGRYAFLVAWAGFSLWYCGHILDWWT